MDSLTTQRPAGGASKSLSNLANVAINTVLKPAADMGQDLGSATRRWNNFCPATLRTGEAAADSVLFQARDVDGASWTTFATLLANNTPTWVFNQNISFANGAGLIIGHPSQIIASNTSELQVLGTSGADSSLILARFSANGNPPSINLLKSRNTTIGSNTIVLDNDLIGQMKFLPDDGADYNTIAAQFHAEVDDPSPAAGDIGMAFVWQQMAGGGAALAETMRLTAAGVLVTSGTPGASVGGFASGQFRLTNPSTDANANSVLTGHNLNGGNKQLWYLGSVSSSNDAIAFINRQNSDLFFSTNNIERLRIEPGGSIAIGVSSALGQLHVSQPSATGAQPALYLEQEDVSEEMIEFDSTIGVGNAIEAIGAKTLTSTHFIKVTLPGGLTRYLPVGTIA